MTNLFVDFETASTVDLGEVGVANYCANPNTRVLMLSWAIDDEPVQLWQPHLESKLPVKLYDALMDENVRILAWNSPFEEGTFNKVLHILLPTSRFFDLTAMARHLSLPGGLDKVGEILELHKDQAKMGWQGGKTKEGTRLIKIFCMPSHAGGEESLFGITEPFYRDWNTNPADWEMFCKYCILDTVSERELYKKMVVLDLPESEKETWRLDQKINQKGLPVNKRFADNAFFLAKKSRDELIIALKQKTGLENPNSNDQFLEWAQKQGYPFGSVKKEFVVSAMNEAKETSQLTDLCREVLEIRKESSKTSYNKLEKLHNFTSPDARLRNQFLYMGAARTGRWSGSGVQVQNMPRPDKAVEKNYARAIEIINACDYEAAKKEFPSIIGMTTSCLRSAFQASPGKKFVVCDLGAIENRGLGWLAQCEATLRVFAEGRDPYLDFAADLFGIDYNDLKARYDASDKEAAWMRQMAKPAVLGAGYGLGGGKLKENKYGDTVRDGLWGYAMNMGVDMPQDLAHKSIEIFRSTRPAVADYENGLWAKLEYAVIEVLKYGGKQSVGPIEFDRKKMKNGQFILRSKLPSGRHLHYINARVVNKEYTSKKGKVYTKPQICYDGIGHGVGATDDKKKWGLVYTYGGKLTENLIQAISRDILVEAMKLADGMGFDIVGHFHDEIVAEVDQNSHLGLAQLKTCMITPPKWAPDFPLGAAGYEGLLYKKG